MNNTNLIGRLTRDPELRYTPTGVAVANFTLAVDNHYKGEADFIPVTVWQKQAESVADHLGKGRLVGVSGSITSGSYENNEGVKVYTVGVNADHVQFLDYAKEVEPETPPTPPTRNARTNTRNTQTSGNTRKK